MHSKRDCSLASDQQFKGLSRRTLLQAAGLGLVSLAAAREVPAAFSQPATIVGADERFPHFQSQPVSYLRVRLQDAFWAPRQKTTREVSVQWISGSHDPAGGLDEYKRHPQAYRTQVPTSQMEHIKFIESMATVIGVRPDPAIEGLIDAWVEPLLDGQGSDGYLGEHFPIGLNHPPHRWESIWWSHEDYTIGHYLEAAIAYREVTGNESMYRSAVRAVNNMVDALLDSQRAYAPGHPEIEQALMRLYEVGGDTKYLRLCGWLLEQRGRHDHRASYGRYAQDHIPVKEQRTIEGHAVRAAYLFNGVTEYVGATGNSACREAVLAVWDDLVNHKMYLHGATGSASAQNEGYRRDPYCIPPNDVYGESCAAFANFQWAHSLFRLTGDARYVDTAERILYNAFYASLSLKGDSSFYCNVAESPIYDGRGSETLMARSAHWATDCCPPNIVKLFNKVGGFFYSVDSEGVFVKHYGASEADIRWGTGLKLRQQTRYPWDGVVTLLIEPEKPQRFSLRLRIPNWAKTHELTVNGTLHEVSPEKGWIAVQRRWESGDRVQLKLPMPVERATMPPRFKGYENRVALQRGPIVYCLEDQDIEHLNDESLDPALESLYLPQEAELIAEHREAFLGGVTVVTTAIRQVLAGDRERSLRAIFVPYGVWGNRLTGPMRIWLDARKVPESEAQMPLIGSCLADPITA